MERIGRRWARIASGMALLGAGAAMLLLPGPGLAAIAGGLAILARDFAWARRLMDAGRDRARRLVERL